MPIAESRTSTFSGSPTYLDPDGLDISQASYDVLISGSSRIRSGHYLRLIARDTSGNWAAFNKPLQRDEAASGDFADGSWGAIDAIYEVPYSSDFDPTRVDAIGWAGHSSRNYATPRVIFTVQTFDIRLPAPPYLISVRAEGEASEWSGDQGSFYISRTGETNEALSVAISTSGEGITPTDFALLPTVVDSVTIPVGASETSLQVSALPDGLPEGDEMLKLSILAGADYGIERGSASLTLRDHPHDAWRYARFGTSTALTGDSEDFDGDGVVNLLERAYGSNPTDAELSQTGDPLQPWVVVESGQAYLRWRQIDPLQDLVYVIEAAGDDLTFSSVEATPELHETLSEQSPVVQVWQVALPEGKPFARLRVEKQ